MTLRVAVVIPTRNRRAVLERLLRAVRDDPDVDEVVVVDDGSTDTTDALLRELVAADDRVHTAHGDGKGAAHARQRGAETAKADVVLFLDDDVVPGPGLAAGHRAHHESSDGVVVVGYMPTIVPPSRRLDDLPVYIYGRDYEAQVRRYEDDAVNVLRDLWAGNFSMRRDEALRVGLAGALAATYHEDKEFGLRCAAAGLHGVFDRELAAEHHPTRPFAAFLRLAHAQGEARVLLHAAHPELGPLDLSGIGAELPRVARPALALATTPVLGALELRLLTLAVRCLAVVPVRRIQVGAAVLARAIAARRGAREAMATKE